jgi:hypothetical protein
MLPCLIREHDPRVPPGRVQFLLRQDRTGYAPTPAVRLHRRATPARPLLECQLLALPELAGSACDRDDVDGGVDVICHELLLNATSLDPTLVRLKGWLRSLDDQTSQRWGVVYNNFFLLFRSRDAEQPLAVALLDHSKVDRIRDDAAGKLEPAPGAAPQDSAFANSLSTSFKIETRVGRVLAFKADTASSCDAWVEALACNSYERVAREAAREAARLSAVCAPEVPAQGPALRRGTTTTTQPPSALLDAGACQFCTLL